MLLRQFEQLIVRATLDPDFAAGLIREPRDTAVEAGYSLMVSESLAGIHASTLEEFAAALHQRLYGRIVPLPVRLTRSGLAAIRRDTTA